IQQRDFRDVYFVELEIEHIEILIDPAPRHRVRDHDESTSEVPSNDDLGDGFAVFARQQLQVRVVEQRALTKRTPAFGHDSVFRMELDQVILLKTWMQFDLVDAGDDAGLID